MLKVVIIGAGSGFGSKLSIDIMSRKPLQNSTICLCDIHEGRLGDVQKYLQRIIDVHKLPTKLEVSTDRRKLLGGADFVVTSIAVGGPAYHGHPYYEDIHIPLKYGLDVRVGDTMNPSGIFRFLRTGPVQLEICRDMEELCPTAMLLNYVNPMCMLTWMHSVGSSIRNVGLCHSVQGTIKRLALFAQIPLEEVTAFVAGINHQAWVLEYRRGGVDVMPQLRELINKPEIYCDDMVRFEMMKNFGYFVTESSGHNSEYAPYFRRNQKLRDRHGLATKTVGMEAKGVREWQKELGEDDITPEKKLVTSGEYASGIIEAMRTDVPFRFNGNVMNNGLISNLPAGSCVEVPCMVDAHGVWPCHVGKLPTQCAAVNSTNVYVHQLAVEAVLNKDREAAFHACCLDPLTASVLSLGEIRAMFDEMWQAEAQHLTWFNK